MLLMAQGSQDEKGNNLWNILPSFDPSTDNAKEYADKVKFLHGICPKGQRAMLAPRLALLCKGTAWGQVKAISSEKLTDPDNGVKALLSALSSWEEAEELQTYEKFDRAFYRVLQRADESVMSYVNRLNVAFDEVGEETTVKEVKAFILLRQSCLNPEDKKRVIAMADGYVPSKVENAMRSLATRVLAGDTTKKKIYPVNFMEEEHEETYYMHDEEIDEDVVFQTLLDEGDDTAAVIQDFEDQVVQVCQDSPELSMAFSAYQEARAKLKEKARVRGFWPLKTGNSKGKGKGKRSKGTMNSFGKRRQSLAERIVSSSCRNCGKMGHWKDECPNRDRSKNTADAHVTTIDVM